MLFLKNCPAKSNNYPASKNPNQMRYLSGGGQDDTVGQRYRRAEMERGEAEDIQEKGGGEGGSTATREREEKQRL